MINRKTFYDAKRLMRSKVYVLITNEETSLHGEMAGMDLVQQIASLQMVRDQVDSLLKEAQKVSKKNEKRTK